MIISNDVFKENNPNVIEAHNVTSDKLRSMEYVWPAYGEYLKFSNDTISYLEKPIKEMLTTDRIQIKINKVKEDKDMLLYYHEVRVILYDYENIKTFYIRNKGNKIEKKTHTTWSYA